MDYITCKNIAKTENIKSAKDWFSYCGKNKNVTYHPERVYKKDWLGWYSFLNKENVPNRKYILNEKYFNYDSRNKYYVLGLICADGYIDKKHNSIKITQHKKDKYTFFIFLICDATITIKKPPNKITNILFWYFRKF